jgi:hypothetical protein
MQLQHIKKQKANENKDVKETCKRPTHCLNKPKYAINLEISTQIIHIHISHYEHMWRNKLKLKIHKSANQ